MESVFFGFTRLDNFDFLVELRYRSAIWTVLFGTFYHTSDSMRGWIAGTRQGLHEACFKSLISILFGFVGDLEFDLFSIVPILSRCL